MRFMAVIGLSCALSLPSFAGDKTSLWDVPLVDKGLFDMGVAWGIKENCDRIEERKVYGASFALKLAGYARDHGYTTKEVKDFYKDKTEKAKLRARVTKYLQDQGLDPDEPNALCGFGDEHIQNETQVGKLLRKA